MSRLGLGVPDFGTTVRRGDIHQHYARTRPALALVCAASGFGKSVLAAQLAQSDLFDDGIWLTFYGQRIVLEDVVERLHGEACEAGGAEISGGVVSAVMPRHADGELAERLRSWLTRFEGRRVCLVLDDAELPEDLGFLELVGETLRDTTSWESRLIATCRQLGDFDPLSLISDYWLVESGELRLDEAECAELVSAAAGGAVSSRSAEAIRKASKGHAATVSVIARHRALLESLESEGELPRSSRILAKHVEAIAVGSLRSDQRASLFVAALLGAGTRLDVMRIAGCDQSVLVQLADVLPLVRLGHDQDGAETLYVHDAVLDAVTSRRFQLSLGRDASVLADATVRQLEATGSHDRALSIVHLLGEVEGVVEWLERCGSGLAEQSKLQLLRRAFAIVPPERLVRSVRLLITKALTLRDTDNLEDALGCAVAAVDLARNGVDSDARAAADAAIILSRVCMDLGRYSEVPAILEPVLSAGGLDPSTECLAHVYLAGAYGHSGLVDQALSHVTSVGHLSTAPGVAPSMLVYACTSTAFIAGQVLGHHSKAVASMARAAEYHGVPRASHLQALGNLGVSLLEIGRVNRASQVLSEVIDECREIGAVSMLTGYAESLSLACEGSGDSESADQWYLLAKDHAARLGDRLVASALGLGRAIVLRARGLAEPALDHAEQAFAFFESAGLTIFGALARLEWAATKLALGDVEVASEAAQAIRDDTSLASAAYHQLKADMILAQIESLQGRFSAAVERIAAHTEYILTESSNWQAAMYVRSFPGLLAVFAAAVGPARLPAHLLNCVTPTYAVPALRVARSRLSLADWRVLAGRLIDAEEIATLEAEYKSVPPVRVRVFGGFEVVTPNGPIAERSWRKRKARLLFAMLVTLQGRDVARDQLMEHMWPDMDEARSRNNFYVVWSTMKRALAGEVAGSVPDCFETVGGLCRSLPEFVSSDLDDFESIVRGLRRAEAVGGADDVLLACDRLAEVYRGDLLPGDLYEDWFAELRDRCRHTFCDALVSGVRILQERRETERAMDLLRRALAVDPWREDLYQLAMELQISRGQRSGAIETYITCQSKLRNELGIDPSVETRSLYQAVLAMEDEPTAAAPRRQ